MSMKPLGKKFERLLSFSATDLKLFLRQKLIRWFYPLIFWCVNTPPFSLYIAYKPDFLATWKEKDKRELALLRKRFIMKNRRNNDGDLSRFYSLILNLEQLHKEGVVGDFAELGVYKGNSASILAHYARKQKSKCYLLDTFAGFDSRDLIGIDSDFGLESFADSTIATVKEIVGNECHVVFVQGRFPESIRSVDMDRGFAAVSLDCDLYQPMKHGLEFFWPRLVGGGAVFIHDYSSRLWPGVCEAVDEFFRNLPERPVLLADKSGTAVVRKHKSTQLHSQQ